MQTLAEFKLLLCIALTAFVLVDDVPLPLLISWSTICQPCPTVVAAVPPKEIFLSDGAGDDVGCVRLFDLLYASARKSKLMKARLDWSWRIARVSDDPCPSSIPTCPDKPLPWSMSMAGWCSWAAERGSANETSDGRNSSRLSIGRDASDKTSFTKKKVAKIL